MAEPRPPIRLPTYAVGDEAKPDHFVASTPRETAAEEAGSLAVGDAAFILRSGRKWSYAVVLEKSEEGEGMLRFEADKGKSRKSFPGSGWGKYIRVIKVDEGEMAKLEAEESMSKGEEESKKAEKVLEEEVEAASAKENVTKNDEGSKAAERTGEKAPSLEEFAKGVSSVFAYFSGPSEKTAANKVSTDAPAIEVKKETEGTKTTETDDVKAADAEANEGTDAQSEGEVETAPEDSEQAKKNAKIEAPVESKMKSSPWGEFTQGASSIICSFPVPFKQTEKTEAAEEKKESVVIESEKTEEIKDTTTSAPITKEEEKDSTASDSNKAEENKTTAVTAATTDSEEDATNETKAKREMETDPDANEEAEKNEETRATENDEKKTSPSPWQEFTNGVSSMLTSFAKLSNKIGQTVEIKHTVTMEAEKESKSTVIESEEIEERSADEKLVAPSSPESALLASEEGRDDAEEKADTASTPPAVPVETTTRAAPVEPPKPLIKLLQTPIQFYKAPTMKEDPALAALAATSFCDDRHLRGVVICENDPTLSVVSKTRAQERLDYPNVDIEKEMKNQGITIIESPKQGIEIDECSVATEKVGIIAAKASPIIATKASPIIVAKASPIIATKATPSLLPW